jgi:hypothetical protein
MPYTVENLPALRAQLEAAEEDYGRSNDPYRGLKPMDRLRRIIWLIELGCREVVDSDRGLVVDGRYIIGPNAWSVVGRHKWYPYRSLEKLAKAVLLERPN